MAKQGDMKVIKTRWIEINKGDDQNSQSFNIIEIHVLLTTSRPMTLRHSACKTMGQAMARCKMLLMYTQRSIQTCLIVQKHYTLIKEETAPYTDRRTQKRVEEKRISRYRTIKQTTRLYHLSQARFELSFDNTSISAISKSPSLSESLDAKCDSINDENLFLLSCELHRLRTSRFRPTMPPHPYQNRFRPRFPPCYSHLDPRT